MEIAELFLIENLRGDLEAQVAWAADRFQQKYGQRPTLCAIHPSLLQRGRNRVSGIQLEARKSLLPNYLWLGVPGDLDTKPFAG
ncbi:MAG: hypothetical protein ACRDFQ_06600 [Anaerolineales bacterium]